MNAVVCGRLCLTWKERTDDGGGDLTLEWGQRRRHVGTIWIRPGLRGRGGDDSVTGWTATWSTWDRTGTGGENARAEDLATALEAVLGALLFQHWVPNLTAREWRWSIEQAARLTEAWRAARKLNTVRWSYTG